MIFVLDLLSDCVIPLVTSTVKWRVLIFCKFHNCVTICSSVVKENELCYDFERFQSDPERIRKAGENMHQINYKMTVQYEGTRYKGWQKQPRIDNTIQGKLETLLSRLLETDIEVFGA